MYAIRAEKMREARVAKAANKNPAPPQAQSKPIEEQKVEPIVTIKEEVKAQPEAQQAPSVAKDNEVKDKKGTNWILWGVLGVAGIFVGINLYKNKR